MSKTAPNGPKQTQPGKSVFTQPVTYTFDNRAYIVQPVFKSEGAPALRDILLRLMRADLEAS